MATSWRLGLPDFSVFARKAEVPTAGVTPPTANADSPAVGDLDMRFARADHTHPSQARKAKLTTATDGTVTWTFSTPFDVGVVPVIVAVAETPSGNTDLVNVQIDGAPTNTSAKLRVNRANRTLASLLSLTILSLPSNPGATTIHAIAVTPP